MLSRDYWTLLQRRGTAMEVRGGDCEDCFVFTHLEGRHHGFVAEHTLDYITAPLPNHRLQGSNAAVKPRVFTDFSLSREGTWKYQWTGVFSRLSPQGKK